jgi:hypothetical protein
MSDPALQYDEQGVLRTHLLPVSSIRVHCALRLSENCASLNGSTDKHQDSAIETVIDGVSLTPDEPRAAIEGGRGKVNIETQTERLGKHVPRPIPEGAVGSEKGSYPSWWLDISSPTYADMKALGKVPFMFCTTIIPYPHLS